MADSNVNIIICYFDVVGNAGWPDELDNSLKPLKRMITRER